jgi:hypothetical protein
MPNWKKVLTSGSAGELSSLFAPSITGSLLGTASYAVTASLPLDGIITASFSDPNITFVKGNGTSFNLDISGLNMMSASYSETASYVNPLRQDVTITGSLLLTSSYISTVDYIDFTILPTPPAFNTGRLHWTDDTKTLQLDTDVNNFELEIGHQSVIRGRNNNSFTLTKGTVVYINGESGNRPTFATASWESDPSSATTIGIVAQDINSSQTGYAVTNGLIRNINTTAFPPGTSLYLSSSGQYTDTPAISPLHEVRLGKTITQAVNGIVYIDIQNGYEIGELHDVLITSASTGDLITWDSGSQVWKNTKQLTGSYALTGSLIITGSTSEDLLRITQTGTGNAFLVEDSTNPDSTPFVIDAAGNVGIGTTSPLQLLHISSSDARVRLQSSTTNIWDVRAAAGGGAQNDFAIQSAGTRGSVYLGAYSTTNTVSVTNVGALVVNSTGNSSFSGSGNVGIGTTTPNARLDVSGSAIITGSLTVTQGITGSLFGTASWAQNAISASFTSTASYVNPLQQNVIITGSIDVQFGNVNLRSNAYFFNGSNTTGVNVSLIGVDSNNIIRIGNQGYLNEIESATNIDGDTQITGSLIVSGSNTTINSSLTTKTFRLTGSSYTASLNDYRIGVRYTNTGSVSIQLPLISQTGQIEYRIKDEEGNATVNTITLVASGSNLIDGSTTAVLRRDYIAVGLYNDGVSNWYIE